MKMLKTTFLLTGLTLILVIAGEYFGGFAGALLAFAFSAAMNFFSYFYSDRIVLRMYRAQPATRNELPRLFAVVEQLTVHAAIPMPKIYVIPTESPNAFATGRDSHHASIVVTHGILALLNDDELEGVLAHELGHVRNRDILTSSIAATLAGAITILVRMAFLFGGGRRRSGGFLSALLMLLLAPVAATLIQLWVSRTREYEADASGAQLTGNPYALASALEKISTVSRQVPLAASPSSAHLFIIAPLLPGQGWTGLFSTHPPIQERIQRLIGRTSVLGDRG
jgi:heat shock protein HtpX